jgi:hypothetical protein
MTSCPCASTSGVIPPLPLGPPRISPPVMREET